MKIGLGQAEGIETGLVTDSIISTCRKQIGTDRNRSTESWPRFCQPAFRPCRNGQENLRRLPRLFILIGGSSCLASALPSPVLISGSNFIGGMMAIVNISLTRLIWVDDGPLVYKVRQLAKCLYLTSWFEQQHWCINEKQAQRTCLLNLETDDTPLGSQLNQFGSPS